MRKTIPATRTPIFMLIGNPRSTNDDRRNHWVIHERARHRPEQEIGHPTPASRPDNQEVGGRRSFSERGSGIVAYRSERDGTIGLLLVASTVDRVLDQFVGQFVEPVPSQRRHVGHSTLR